MKKHILLFAALALLAGCKGLLPEAREPDRRFVLTAPSLEKHSGAPLPESMEIILPQPAAGLDGARIALLKDNHELDYYAGARWAEDLPAMTQSLLVAAFDHSNLLKAVGNDVIGMAPTLRLVVELRHFEAIYGSGLSGAPDAHVELVAKLFREPGHALMTTRSYEEKTKASANQLSSIVQAFDQSFGKAASAMVSDVAAEAAKPRPKRAQNQD